MIHHTCWRATDITVSQTKQHEEEEEDTGTSPAGRENRGTKREARQKQEKKKERKKNIPPEEQKLPGINSTILHGFSWPGPRAGRGGFQNLAGRAGLGQAALEISRVGSHRVRRFSQIWRVGVGRGYDPIRRSDPPEEISPAKSPYLVITLKCSLSQNFFRRLLHATQETSRVHQHWNSWKKQPASHVKKNLSQAQNKAFRRRRLSQPFQDSTPTTATKYVELEFRPEAPGTRLTTTYLMWKGVRGVAFYYYVPSLQFVCSSHWTDIPTHLHPAQPVYVKIYQRHSNIST